MSNLSDFFIEQADLKHSEYQIFCERAASKPTSRLYYEKLVFELTAQLMRELQIEKIDGHLSEEVEDLLVGMEDVVEKLEDIEAYEL